MDSDLYVHLIRQVMYAVQRPTSRTRWNDIKKTLMQLGCTKEQADWIVKTAQEEQWTNVKYAVQH